MSNELPYDPKLKEAMAEIKVILKKHDIAGAVSLVSETHSEYLYDFPSWSGIKLTGDGLKMDIKHKDFKAKADFNEAATIAMHVLHQIRDIGGKSFMIFEKVINTIIEKTGIEVEHEPFHNSTHIETIKVK